MEWYYTLGIISYGIFIIQFLLSFISGDTDLDVDFDGETDFSFSDLISFKGLIHFLMGLSGWLMITGKVTTINVLTACIIGIIFMVVLYYIYQLALKLQHIPTRKEGKERIGSIVTICYPSVVGNQCICVYNGTEEINCIAKSPLIVGDSRVILEYENGIYYIS